MVNNTNKRNPNKNKRNSRVKNTQSEKTTASIKDKLEEKTGAAIVGVVNPIYNQFRYKIGFGQSVSTGIVHVEGYFHFDNYEDGILSSELIINNLNFFERSLESNGYQVAKKAAPKKNGVSSSGHKELDQF